MSRKAQAAVSQNRLLAALPPKTRRLLERHLEPMHAGFGKVLQAQNESVTQVCFPVSCVVSLLIATRGGRSLEIGIVGAEGMVGVSLALGVAVSPTMALVQGEGAALRIGAAEFRRLLRNDRELERCFAQYAHVVMVTAMRNAACNSRHPLKARLARWLSMMRDRLPVDEMSLTQEMLAGTLGVRRSGISEIAAELQRRGLIRYARGHISILDRKGLRAAACSCYGALLADVAGI